MTWRKAEDMVIHGIDMTKINQPGVAKKYEKKMRELIPFKNKWFIDPFGGFNNVKVTDKRIIYEARSLGTSNKEADKNSNKYMKKCVLGKKNNLEPKKDKNGKVVDGLHKIGQISVDSGQIGITDPGREDFDLTVNTNLGDGMFPVYEDWSNNKRIALIIPLSTDIHNALQDILPDPKPEQIKQGEEK